jgi:hypothetical protein
VSAAAAEQTRTVALYQASVHEAGHCVVLWQLGCPVERIELNNQGGGCCLVSGVMPTGEDRGKVFYAGYAAEAKGFPDHIESVRRGASSDLAKLQSVLIDLVMCGAPGGAFERIIQWVDLCIAEHWNELLRLAVQLEERRVLNSTDLARLGFHWPGSEPQPEPEWLRID